MTKYESGTALVRCPSYEYNAVDAALNAALSLCGGLDWVAPGMKILIKPNMLRPARPAACVSTHPSLVCALTKRLTGLGAKVTIAESPGGPYSSAILKTLYSLCGMEAARDAGAILNYDTSVVGVYYPEAKVLKHIDLIKPALECDALISLAKLKTHSFMTYTGAVKNLFGLVPGTIKAEYHYRFPEIERFADMLVDLCEYVSPVLSIIDAVTGMEGDGPSGGNPRQVSSIIASRNPHFADAVACELIGLAEDDSPTLRVAKARGLLEGYTGPSGESTQSLFVESFQPPSSCHSRMSFHFADRMPGILRNGFERMMEARPALIPEKCVGCGICRDNCPAKCIELDLGKPSIDRKKCIKCFCCQELCPTHAMQISRSRIMKLLQK